tara:strand:- start:410 stop:694 length:285 start_codon:yes stop_codon:yes gene_type:complete
MVSKHWRGLFKKDYLKDDDSLIKVSDMLEGNVRKENEDYEKYRIRRAAEKQLLRDYYGGLMIPNEIDFSNPEQPKSKPYINPTRQAKKLRKLNG